MWRTRTAATGGSAGSRSATRGCILGPRPPTRSGWKEVLWMEIGEPKKRIEIVPVEEPVPLTIPIDEPAPAEDPIVVPEAVPAPAGGAPAGARGLRCPGRRPVGGRGRPRGGPYP